jgi:HK97 family phage major capsid protein
LHKRLRTGSRHIELKSMKWWRNIAAGGFPKPSNQSLATAFLSSLSAVSAFDALWPSMLQVPLRTHIVSVSATITSTSISEGSVKPASQISLTASDLDVVKCAAFVAMTAELLRSGTPGALAVLQTELRTAIARATNSIFLPILTASAPSFPSSGVAGSGVRQDLRTLLANVTSGSASKLFLITGRTIAEALAVLPDTAGGPAFPLATVTGGSIGGIPIIVCDETAIGEIILVDASQVAAGTEGLVFDTADQASLQLDTVGDSPPTASTNLVSLWQLNLLAVRAERYIGAKVLRSDAVAKITGVGYTGGSPA